MSAVNDINTTEKYDQYEHILKKPGRFADDVLSMFDNPEIVNITDGMERLFMEICTGACDNVMRSHRCQSNPGTIKVRMNGTDITISNGEVPISV
jgi:hypothetical protein